MKYPCLVINKSKIANNVNEIVQRCTECGISVCGVIKGCSGIPEIAEIMIKNGCSQLGTSRISQVKKCKEAGIYTEYLMLRIPAISELTELVEYCDMSLQSDLTTLKHLEEECQSQNKTHKVIVMTDLGDLREGIWSEDELLDTCLTVEKELSHVHLSGIGVNLGCYGAIKPTAEKMNDLLSLSEKIQRAIGRKLEIISGGATTSYSLVHWGTMPSGINHLRIGDNILLSRGLQTNWKIQDMDYLDMTAFKIKAEVIEVKDKPSYPQGEFAFNAYGKLPHYENRGVRKRALLALGNADVGDVKELVPILSGVEIVGGSSDHLILDVTDSKGDINLGDIIEFYPRYTNMLHATNTSDVNIKFE